MKTERIAFTSPKGVAVFPKLNVPDTKFDADGVYTVKLRVSGAEAEAMIEKIEAASADGMAKAKTALLESKQPKDKVLANKLRPCEDKPYREAVDADGEPTGDIEFNFKMKAQYTTKDGTVKKNKPAFFDAKGKPLAKAPEIWGGSTLRVQGTMNPWNNPKGECGVSLRMSAVQIISLRQGGFGGSFEADAEGDFLGDDSVSDSDSTGTDGAQDF